MDKFKMYQDISLIEGDEITLCIFSGAARISGRGNTLMAGPRMGSGCQSPQDAVEYPKFGKNS